jgi:hypothetical protein
MTVESGREARATFVHSWFKVTIPIRSEAAVLATEGRPAWSCLTAAIHAAWKGWIP